MKINKNIYNQITSTPFEVQELDNGVTVELHSFNQNEGLFNTYIPQGKFVVWTNAGGKNYRLLLEDGFYKEMRDMYMSRCNQEWVSFWDKVDKDRNKLMKFVYAPVVLVMFALIFVFMQLPNWASGVANISTISTVCLVVVLVGFLVFTMFLNKRIDKSIKIHNETMVESIKNILGHKKFDQLIETQRAYYDKYFAVKEEEVKEEVTEEKTEVLEVEENLEASNENAKEE